MKSFKLAVAVLCAATLGGCGLFRSVTQPLANAPTQIVMARANSAPGNVAPILLEMWPPDGGQVSVIVENYTGVESFMRGTKTIPPGLAATSDLYVLAHWGGDFDVYDNLHIYVSNNSRHWGFAPVNVSAARAAVAVSNYRLPSYVPFGIAAPLSPNTSRPAIAYFPATSTWFIALTDPTTRRIVVLEMLVQCQGAPGVCLQDNDGHDLYETVPLSLWTDIGVAGASEPALAVLGGELVLAFSAGGVLTVATSTTGRAFLPAGGAIATRTTPAGQVQLNTTNAPYLHAAPGEFVLAATQERGAAMDAVLFNSTNGLAWTELNRWITGAGFTNYPMAVAGITSDRIVAFPAAQGVDVDVSIEGGPLRRLGVGQNYGVALAKGPGPITTERFDCPVGNTLTATTSTATVTGFGVHAVAFETRGEFSLECQPLNARSAGVCAQSTRYASVRRSSQSQSFLIECWTRRPN